MRLYLLCQKLILTVALFMGFERYALANCGTIQVVVGTASGNAQKCNEGSCPGTPPTYYLTSKITTSVHSSGQDGPVPGDPASEQDSQSGSYEITDIVSINWPSCSTVITRSGQATFKYILTTNGVVVEPDSVSYNGTRNANGSWSPNGDAYNSEAGMISTITNAPTINQCALTETEQNDYYSYDYGFSEDGYKKITILSNPCTDDMLRSEIQRQVNLSSFTWVTNAPDVTSFGSATYTLDANHFSGSGSKMKYFFHITDCQPHLTYKVTWYQKTTFPGSATPIMSQMTEEITGSGDPVAGVNTSTHTVDMPNTPSTITEEDIKMVVVP